MSNPYDDMYNAGMQQFGELLGMPWSVLRPDYTAVDNTPALISSNQIYRCDPDTQRFAESKFQEVSYYGVFGNRPALVPGDILSPSSGDIANSPIITVAAINSIKEAVAFRTSRVCTLRNSVTDVIHTNVYFDFLGVGFPGSSLNRNLEDSLRLPNVRVAMFTRPNVFRLRTQLVETDSTEDITNSDGNTEQEQVVWKVEEIDYLGNIMVLTLRVADDM